MNRRQIRLDKLESDSQSGPRSRRVAVVVFGSNETEKEAMERHFESYPENKDPDGCLLVHIAAPR